MAPEPRPPLHLPPTLHMRQSGTGTPLSHRVLTPHAVWTASPEVASQGPVDPRWQNRGQVSEKVIDLADVGATARVTSVPGPRVKGLFFPLVFYDFGQSSRQSGAWIRALRVSSL